MQGLDRAVFGGLPAIPGNVGAALFSLTALKAVGGVLLFCAGMGAGALLHWALSGGPGAAPSALTTSPPLSEDEVTESPSAAPSNSAPPPVSPPSLDAAAARSSASPPHAATAAPATDGSMVAERAVIQEARLALRDHDPAKALDAWQRHKAQFKKPRLADVRDDLLRQAMDMRDAQPHK